MEKSYAEKEYLVLKTIYDACKANNFAGIDPFSLGEKVGLGERELNMILVGIDQKGLLSNQSTGTYVLNYRGVELADQMENENKTVNRYKVLTEIYNLSKANPVMPVSIYDIEKHTQIFDQEMNGILLYLEERGLIEFPGGDIVRIKGRGIDEIESTQNHPDQRTENFPPSISYTMHIHGDNYGGLQQGGEDNTQNNQININPDFMKAIEKLLDLVGKSSLTPVKKIKTKADIHSINELANLERTPEVIEEANSKIEAVKEVISMTADMTSLGMVLIPVLQAAFVS